MKFSLPKPRPRKSKASRPSLEMPPFVANLMRDMRDRRLIVPAIALAVAIIAVPVMLRSGSEPAPAAIPVVLPDGSGEVLPAVLTEQRLGVRDYRKRLDELKSKNPFEQKFKLTPEELADATQLIETPAAGTVTDAPAAPAGGSSSTPTDDAGGTSPSTEPAPKPGPTTNEPSGEILILAPRIDLRLGKLGTPRTFKDVKLGDILPKRQKPIISLVSVSDDLKEASFIVSSGVTSTNGEGKCAPSRRQCEFLTIKEREVHKFKYGPHETVFRLVIDDIREKIVDRRKLETD